LRDPVLHQRYEEIAGVVAEHLSRGAPLAELMGGGIDVAKLVSSITLFRAAATRLSASDPNSGYTRLAQVCEAILERANAQGHPPCAFTLEQLAQ